MYIIVGSVTLTPDLMFFSSISRTITRAQRSYSVFNMLEIMLLTKLTQFLATSFINVMITDSF